MDARSDDCAVIVSDLTVRHSSTSTVGPFSFMLPSQAILGVVGVNGSGKTTLLRALCGLVSFQGSAVVLGNQVRFGHMPPDVGAMLERPAFVEHGTGRFNIQTILRRSELRAIDIDELLLSAGLDPASRTTVSHYSHGMRQRLAIARATMRQPRLLVLDEPGNALDPHGNRWLKTLVDSHAADGGTVILASHVLHEVESLATHLLLLHNGVMLGFGQAEGLLRQAGTLESLFFSLVPDETFQGRNRLAT